MTDEEIIQLLHQSDENAFSLLYKQHWQFLFTAAYNALRQREDAMDICQSIFLWIWENRCQLRIETNLRAYLYTAVKYKIANLIRKGKVSEILLEDILSKDISQNEVNLLEVQELQLFIARLIGELPDKCREVFLLSREEHLSHKEISSRLGISERTVDDHISRALKKLRLPLSRLANIFLLM